MDRRAFTRDLLGLLGATGALALRPPPLLGARPLQVPPRVDGDRLNRRLGELAAFGRTPEGGISRFAYGEADLRARDYVMGLMRRAGLEVRVDAAGNILGRRAGAERDLPPLMMGSHIDSVPEGGNYDGQVGSMGSQCASPSGRIAAGCCATSCRSRWCCGGQRLVAVGGMSGESG